MLSDPLARDVLILAAYHINAFIDRSVAELSHLITSVLTMPTLEEGYYMPRNGGLFLIFKKQFRQRVITILNRGF